jgi:glycosyltransferase involved in cell wall biosynthesis
MMRAAHDPVASVVIPCRYHASVLARCLDSVCAQRTAAEFEIVVVDADADDAIAAVVRGFPQARIVRCRDGLLPGAARNLGASQARGTWLAFIDADCVAEDDWLENALAALAAGARVVGGSVSDGQKCHPIAVTDNLLQFSDLSPGRPAGPSRLLPSCNLGISREDFDRLGGFPPALLAAGEDILFCYRAAKRWADKLVFEPRMRVRHFGRTSLGQFWTHQERFGHARGAYGLELQPAHRRLGRHAITAPAIAAKRVSYLVCSALRWQPVSIFRMILLSPILLFGLAAWCRGFRRGCREPIQEILDAAPVEDQR